MMAKFIKLKTVEHLDELFQKSHEEPVVIFKHSVTCPISSHVYSEVAEINAEVNLVVVQTERSISNAIAERTGIRHESPQAIVLKDGKPVYHASHYDVTAEEVNAKLR